MHTEILSGVLTVRLTPALRCRIDAEAQHLGLRTVDLARIALAEHVSYRRAQFHHKEEAGEEKKL